MVFSSIFFAVPYPPFGFWKSACLAFFAITAETRGFETLESFRYRFIHHTSRRNWRNVPNERVSFRWRGKDAIKLLTLEHWTIRISGKRAGRSFLAARTEALFQTLLKG
jgi:hypothetical protein